MTNQEQTSKVSEKENLFEGRGTRVSALFNFEGPQKRTFTMVEKHTQPREANLLEYGGVAQLGEHLPCKQGVDSSILFISTTAGAEQFATETSTNNVPAAEARAKAKPENREAVKGTDRSGHRNGLIAQVVRAHA